MGARTSYGASSIDTEAKFRRMYLFLWQMLAAMQAALL